MKRNVKGLGSYIKINRKKGITYRLTVFVGIDPITKKRINKHKTLTPYKELTKKELNLELILFGQEVENNTDNLQGLKTLDDLFKKYLEYCRLNHKKVTYENEVIQVKPVSRLAGNFLIKDLSVKNLNEIINRIMTLKKFDNKGQETDFTYKSSSLNRMYAQLRACLQWAWRNELIEDNSIMKIKKPKFLSQDSSRIKTYSKEEYLSILDQMQIYHPKLVDVIKLGYLTGMSRSEILGLAWEDIDLDNNLISVNKARVKDDLGSTKNDYRNRTIYISKTCNILLRDIRAKQLIIANAVGYKITDYTSVFSEPSPKTGKWKSYSYNNITHQMYRVQKKLNLGSGMGFHTLRHTHATELLKLGIHPKIVQERLGHANISMTLDIYSHVIPGMQKQAIDQFEKVIFTK